MMIPIIPVREIVCMPGVESSIRLGRDFSITAASVAIEKFEGDLILLLQKDTKKIDIDISEDSLYSYGLLVKASNLVKTNNDVYLLNIKGIKRIKANNIRYNEELKIFESSYIKVNTKKDIEEEVQNFEMYKPENIIKISTEFMRVDTVANVTEDGSNIIKIKDLEELIDTMLYYINIPADVKQKFLEMRSLKERIDKFYTELLLQKQINQVENEVNSKLKTNIDEAQRQYILREKIKVLKDEIEGENHDKSELQIRLDKSKMPEDFKKKVQKDLDKLSNVSQMSPEYNVLLNYIELVLSLPYTPSNKKQNNIIKAKKILNDEHYGLKEVKDAVLEFLAVIELKKQEKNKNYKKAATVLCLVGPPGVGKTSFASSIANAMNREFTKISLGGVNDESEIRGHRRTYVAAMPGRIIDAIKRTGVNNPVILLDEIDKLDSGFKGDPASALLEVLDPNQNYKFEDHFVDYPYDLSNVFFICTANTYQTIPEALYDRLEVIYIDSYTEIEKLNIAKKYLIKQVEKETAIKLNISDKLILKIIDSYTREAGVRNLKRELVKIARKKALEKLENIKLNNKLVEADLVKYLGNEKFKPDKLAKKDAKVGRVKGLAWTSVGGTTLDVEGVKMPGSGKLQLTGKLGEVMQESAKVAYSYVRSIVKNDFTKDTDVHLHFPEGATPKDGPSAGITITTTILSVIENKKVRQDIAMTGEITLVGDVLAVGGIKEKVIAAHRIGIKEVILPKENEVDITKLPDEIRESMKFNFVSNYSEVKKIVFKK
ncbi:endopeptidase La [Oceanivirga miroungae]|uniref:Lon protease n=1 Tax=Oceanivirga miroungae TaxID=1130046 RepID=A0A6I8MDR8_9FUSO|nr:endopeptidase La [Oceanivirga miroungae]VWL85314.1 ATP-dependent protease La [Oceanivirga miroungae]